MKRKADKTTIRPLGFCSILFLTLFFLVLLCIIVPFIQNAVLMIKNIKDLHSFFKFSLFAFLTFLFAFLLGFIFLFPIFGQKVVVQDKKMSVYVWGKNKWTFDLSAHHEAKFGFYYQDKLDKLLHRDRKYLSIQVKTGKDKACFPVSLYSSKQTQTIVFILNNSADKKEN